MDSLRKPPAGAGTPTLPGRLPPGPSTSTSALPPSSSLPALRSRLGPRGLRHHDESLITNQDKDRIVQQTDVDASGSRVAAVEKGYLVDPFAEMFYFGGDTEGSGAGGQTGQRERPRRFPLINRGTYTRTTAIDLLVLKFLEDQRVEMHQGARGTGGKRKTMRRQIISLGAGSDTRFFRLRSQYPHHLTAGLLYHELDFPAVTLQKTSIIARHQQLSSLLLPAEDGEEGPSAPAPPIEIDTHNGRINSPHYYLHPFDIRLLSPSIPPEQLPKGIDYTLPTLFISECCLIYLSPSEADNILKWITTTAFPPSPSSPGIGLTLYEPIGSDDPFGRVMIANLATRGIVLKTLKKYSSLERQRERLRCLGFTAGLGAGDVCFIYDNWVGGGEKGRIAQLEMLDEVEEWELLGGHYAVVWGWRGGGGGEEDIWKGWREVMTQEDTSS